MLSTSTPPSPDAPAGWPRRGVLAAALAALSGCAVDGAAPVAWKPPDGEFPLPDGARLPYRCWRPAGALRGVILALHGFNDSRDAWALPGPVFAAAGWALYAPDQRGFGAAPGRGLWPGADRLAADAVAMAAELRRLHPAIPLVMMGESMGGAVLLHMATSLAPPDARYVLLAPALWGRAEMNLVLRSGLWAASTFLPGYEVTRAPSSVRVIPSDNDDALRALSRNPLTLRGTRFDTLRGLVDLMDLALAAAPRFAVPALFLYGANDDLVPKIATRTVWQGLPQPGPVRAYYRGGYHLLFRDLSRNVPVADTLAWLSDPAAPLPSGADRAAASWLAGLS